MEEKDYLTLLINLHNGLSEISVRGDDTIRMANMIQMCRTAIMEDQSGRTDPNG